MKTIDEIREKFEGEFLASSTDGMAQYVYHPIKKWGRKWKVGPEIIFDFFDKHLRQRDSRILELEGEIGGVSLQSKHLIGVARVPSCLRCKGDSSPTN